MPSFPIDTIHFDLDGTLIDSAGDLALALADMCHALQLPRYDQAQVRAWIGNGSAMLVKRALQGKREVDEAAIDEALFDQAHAIFLDAYDTRLCEATRPYEGVIETLRKLKTQGYTLTVITNKPSRFLPKLLEGLDLTVFFDAVAGGDSFVRKKPDPLPLLAMCDKLGTTPARSLMVGDSRNDLLAAKACGMRAIGVTYGYRNGEDLSRYDPVGLIDRFKDLATLLRKEHG